MLLLLLFVFFRYLKPDSEKKSKHKTAVIKKTLNPEFNQVRALQRSGNFVNIQVGIKNKTENETTTSVFKIFNGKFN